MGSRRKMLEHVFPAPAGMSRRHAMKQFVDGSFPRPRGDEPRTRACVAPAGAFSPPPRG